MYHLVETERCYFLYGNGNTKSYIFLTYHILKGLHSSTSQAQTFPQPKLNMKVSSS